MNHTSVLSPPLISTEIAPERRLDHHRAVLQRFASGPGPKPADYPHLDAWILSLEQDITSGRVSLDGWKELRRELQGALSTATMMGMAYQKPHGYAGDFEIIDRIYREDTAQTPHLAAWDHYFHQHAAATAVRNRKGYFQEILDRHSQRKNSLRVLNIASGPGRCMSEWMAANPESNVSIDCVELDPNAIAYAKMLNGDHLDRITFIEKNALRFQPTKSYDVIWASGIFDYFSDKAFRFLLRRLLEAAAPRAEIVIGNFSTRNPSRAYMELFGEWHLNHRSPKQLRSLASDCGVEPEDIRVGAESERVNLFLHVQCP